MSTTTVKTIVKAGTGDYTTLQAWENAKPANLTTSIAGGEIWQGQCTDPTDEFTNAGGNVLTVASSTTDATGYAHLTTGSSASFRDNANKATNALRYNVSNGVAVSSTGDYSGSTAIVLDEAYARVSNMQVYASGTKGASGIGVGGNRAGLRVEFCIVEGQGSQNTSAPLAMESTADVLNCVIVQRGTGRSRIMWGTRGTIICNCTIVCPSDVATKPTVAIESNYNSVTVRNCAIFGATAVKGGSTTFTFETCMTDVASPPAGCTTATYANQFQTTTDATRDFRLKTGADCIDAGTTDSTNAPNDIIGTARPSGSAYDVGAWEFVAAGGTTRGTPFGHRGTAFNGGRTFHGIIQ